MSVDDFEFGQSMEDASTQLCKTSDESHLPICKQKISKLLGHEFECFDVLMKPSSQYDNIEKLLSYTEPTFWLESESSDDSEDLTHTVKLDSFPESVQSVHICVNLDHVKKA